MPETLTIKEIECPEPVEGRFYTYLLLCKDNSIYCGSTKDIGNPLKEHSSGGTALWTKMRRPVRLVYYEVYTLLTDARQREKQIKGWTIQKKMNLINGVWGKI